MNVDWRERIVIDQAIHYGEPCITATRVPASVIVGSIVDGDKPEQILVAYPQLTGDDLKAALNSRLKLPQQIADLLTSMVMTRQPWWAGLAGNVRRNLAAWVQNERRWLMTADKGFAPSTDTHREVTRA